MVSAVILASGRSGAEFQERFGVTHKCLVEIAGRTMLERTLDTVRRTEAVGRIVIVGPKAVLGRVGIEAEILDSDSDGYSENLACGVRAVTGEWVLVIAADVPLLEARDLEAFLSACLQAEADVCFPMIAFQAMQTRLPGVRKTWYELRDGTFTKGNAVVAPPDFFLRRLDRIETLFQHRKQKRWAGMIGPAFAGRLLSRAASRCDVERALSLYLKAHIQAIPCAPELAADVDEVSDVAFMEAALQRRESGREAIVCCG
jgi:GTP:adenosylcobinamide-phosphate guanylyltransferase